MKKLSLFAGLMMLGLLTYAQGTWSIDKVHSNVSFSVEHLVISEVTGKFGSFEGEIVSSSEDFTGSTVNFTIDVNSVNTDNGKRDGHLKGDDFFNAKEYPQITFMGKSLDKVEGKKYKLKGDLTIRDITKSVELDVKYGGTITDQRGNVKAGFKITGTINRFDYNMKFDAAMEAGGLVVGEDVKFVCNVEVKKES
jgi:polyisoprenoid-binding protein YceI